MARDSLPRGDCPLAPAPVDGPAPPQPLPRGSAIGTVTAVADKSYQSLLVQIRGEFVRVSTDMPWGRCTVDTGENYEEGDGFRFGPSDQHFRASNVLWDLMRRIVDTIGVVGIEVGSEARYAEEWSAALSEFGEVSGEGAQLGSIGFSRLVRVGVG